MELTNFVTSDELYTGSAATSRFAICPFLGIENPAFPSATRCAAPLGAQSCDYCALLLRCPTLGALSAILRPALLAVGHAHRIERAAHHVIAHAGQILHTAPADQNNRVFLQVVADSGDIGRNFDAVGQADARDLAQRRVW